MPADRRSNLGRLWAASRLAWSEFCVGFFRKSTGSPGIRDFVALAAFFSLMTLLMLFGWSVREGLWGRIEQVLLGSLPAGQLPVRLSYHIDNPNQINDNILREFAQRFPDLMIVPQRSSNGASGALILPGLAAITDEAGGIVEGDESWGQGISDKRLTPFRMEAMPLASPMWEWILSRSGATAPKPSPSQRAPLMVAVSSHLFKEHFRYETYRNGILANRMVPCALKALLPAHPRRIEDLEYLVLEIKENIVDATGRRSTVPSYHAFRALWVESFATPERTAMIVPLSTYEVLLTVNDRQKVDFQGEALAGEDEPRISQIRLAEIDLETEGKEEFTKLASCLGAVGSDFDEGPSADARRGQDICAAAPVSSDGAAKSDSSGSANSCEQLWAKGPLKYPHKIDNGQDLLICSGAHRRLRGSEVAACGIRAGLGPVAPAKPLLQGRLEAFGVERPPSVEWLGLSRVAVPCTSLQPPDITRAKALKAERELSEKRAGAPPTPAGGQPSGGADDDAWINECEDKAAAPDRIPGDTSRGIVHLDGYHEATVYAAPSAGGTDAFSLPESAANLWRKWTGTAASATTPAQANGHGGALNKLTNMLLEWETTLGREESRAPVPVLRLDPAYESALVRFGVLSLIIEKVSTPIAISGLALYLFLTGLILSTAIDHRRRQYGLLLMTGIRPRQIGYIVRLQIVLSCIVGGAVGFGVFYVAASALNRLLAESAVVLEARRIIGLDVPAFLPELGWLTFLGLWASMTLLAIIVGTAVLRAQGVTTARAPIDLVKS